MILLPKPPRQSTLIACCIISALFCGCIESKSQKEHTPNDKSIDTTNTFVIPRIPSIFTTPEQRREYLVLHYWDNFNFSDTTFMNKPEITEQAFADYLNLFPQTSFGVVEQSISMMLNKALAGSTWMFKHFIELYEKYLYDPNSPFRNEEYYIATLKAIIAHNDIDESTKVRPQYQLEMALKNRVGNLAANFEFISPQGVKSSLRTIKAPYIILFFNNPDCHDCARVKELLSQVSMDKAKVVAIYVDEDEKLWKNATYPTSWVNGYAPVLRNNQLYDLKAIPTLYLLDNNQQVILKDAPVEEVVRYVNSQ